MLDESFRIRVVLAPKMDKLGEMVRTKDGPVSGQVVKVVHDDSDEEIENKEGADNEEADEVGIGHIGPTAALLARII